MVLGIINAELLRGTKNKKEFDRLDDLLKGLEYLSLTDDIWEKLYRFSYDLFRKGVAVPLTDTYIAQLSIENNVSILQSHKITAVKPNVPKMMAFFYFFFKKTI